MDAGFDPTELIDQLPKSGQVMVGGATGESTLLGDAVMASGDALEATFTGIFVPDLNRITYLPNSACRVETFFMTPELAAHRDQVKFSLFAIRTS